MLTETNANYYTYMTDSDGDGMPDAGGDGFASRLCFDGKRFYMFYGNTFYVSLDGISWTLKSIPTVFGEEYSNVQYIG